MPKRSREATPKKPKGQMKSRPLTPELLGEKGETAFADICPAAGLTANRSSVDRMGWDYFVDFPYPEAGSSVISLDKRPHPPECKIQIKAAWIGTDHVELSLSAAEKLGRSRLPSFIIVPVIDENCEAVCMFAFHMLDANLERVLKRLRKATADNSLRINKATITYNVADATKLPFNGKHLAEYISKCCGTDVDAYHAKKADLIKNLGFTAYRYEGIFAIVADSQRDVDELFLGLKEGKLSSIKTNEVRFGIKIPVMDGTEGSIKIIPQSGIKCRLFIQGKRDPMPIKFNVDIYAPPYIKRPDEKDILLRLSNDLFDMVIDGSDVNVTNKYLVTPDLDIDDAVSALKFQAVMSAGGGKFDIFRKGKLLYSSRFSAVEDAVSEKVALQQIKLVEDVRLIFNTAGIYQRKIMLNYLINRSGAIRFLYALIKGEKDVALAPMKTTSNLEMDFEAEHDGILIQRIPLGNINVAFYALMTVNVVKSCPDTVIHMTNISLRDVSKIDSESESYAEYFEEAKMTTGLSVAVMMDFPEIPI